MKALILSRSKFFREALKFTLSDVFDEVVPADCPTDMARILNGDRDITAGFCDLDCEYGEIERARRILEKSPSGAKFLLFSFDPMEKKKHIAQTLGADAYIHRPLNAFEVLKTVKEVVLKEDNKDK